MNKRFKIEGVSAQTPLKEAAPALLEAKAAPLFELEDAARGGADMSAVHDMRVASRRLREAMRLLAPIYPDREFKSWYRRVRRITRALGPVRDSDVFIDDFARMAPTLGPGGQRCVAFMVGFRMGQRVGELERLNKELSTLDLVRSRKEFRKLAQSVLSSPEADKPFSDFAHASVAERAAVVFGAQPRALDEANMDEQHELRIDYKRLRYAVEAFAPCYAEDFDDLHATLTSFQDALGDLHDVHVFLDMLREPERVESAGRAGVSADDMLEVETTLASRAHAEFVRFSNLAAETPPATLLPALLLPLSRQPEPSAAASQELAKSEDAGHGSPSAPSADPSADAEATPWSLEWADGAPAALADEGTRA